MFWRSTVLLAAVLVVSGATIGTASAEETPFSGTWSPQCAPAEKDVVDNQLATVVIYGDALKHRDLQCRIEGLKKRRTVYDAQLECFRKSAEPVKAMLRVTPLSDGKINIRISEGRYNRDLERCGR